MQLALAEGNAILLSCRLLEYTALLHEHIQKEDQVLFPWLDGRLSDQERKEISAEFIFTWKKCYTNIATFEDKLQLKPFLGKKLATSTEC